MAIKLSFIFMCVCFSITHGCVNSLLGIASAELGYAVSGVQTGLLNGFYGLSALFMSSALISVFGTKWALVCSLVMYVPYVSCFMIIDAFPSVTWPAACTGGVIGGVAAGTLWTAQGVYYAETVKVYTFASGEPKEKVSAEIGGYFAFTYCFGELICRFLSSFLFPWGGPPLVYTVFTILSATGAAGVFLIRDFGKECAAIDGTAAGPAAGICSAETCAKMFNTEKAMGALNILWNDSKMKFLFVGPVTFAVNSTVLNLYLSANVIPDSIGASYIGYLGMCISGGATIFSVIFSRLALYMDKAPIYVFGQFVWYIMGLIFLTHTNEQLGHFFPLFLLYTLHGIARSTYETSQKAIFADIWNNEKERNYAFANLIIANGIGAGIFNILFPHIPREAIGYIALFIPLLGMLGLYQAKVRGLQEKMADDEAY